MQFLNNIQQVILCVFSIKSKEPGRNISSDTCKEKTHTDSLFHLAIARLDRIVDVQLSAHGRLVHCF